MKATNTITLSNHPGPHGVDLEVVRSTTMMISAPYSGERVRPIQIGLGIGTARTANRRPSATIWKRCQAKLGGVSATGCVRRKVLRIRHVRAAGCASKGAGVIKFFGAARTGPVLTAVKYYYDRRYSTPLLAEKAGDALASLSVWLCTTQYF